MRELQQHETSPSDRWSIWRRSEIDGGTIVTRKQIERRTVAINRIVDRELTAQGYRNHDWTTIEYLGKYRLRHMSVADAAGTIVNMLVKDMQSAYAESMTFGSAVRS